MNNQGAVFTMTEKRTVLRVLKFLNKAPALRDSSIDHDKLLLISSVGGAIACENSILQKLISLGNIAVNADQVTITTVGRTFLQSNNSALNADVPECNLDHRSVDFGGQIQTAIVNIAESPLAMLYRLNKQTGRRFLSDEEFQAGERLRADFTRGNLLPSITANWELFAVKRSRGERGGGADLSDNALDCRARVEKALKAVGPELSGVLLDICCFLKGLELVERERLWPVRSAKMLLKAALSILHRHYTAGQKNPL